MMTEVYSKPFCVRNNDCSPKVEADEFADGFSLEGLDLRLKYSSSCREVRERGTRAVPLGSEVSLVAPLDGNDEFVSHSGEFTVKVALGAKGGSVIGVGRASIGSPLCRCLRGGKLGGRR